MRLYSAAFRNGAPIPKRYTGDGEDLSPPLQWEDVPEGTQELALLCEDPDAPVPEPWVHWVLYGLPPETRRLPEGIPPQTTLETPVRAMQGRNSWSRGRTTGYRGPAPPPGHGRHRYFFRLYVLDQPLGLNPGVDKQALLQAMQGHVLQETQLMGTYQR